MNENSLSNIAIGACIAIHKTLGPGLLESVYEKLLAYELKKRQICFKRQAPIPIVYEDLIIDVGFRADFILEDRLILELKSVEQILMVHRKQLLTYLKVTQLKLGLLINFNVPCLNHGIFRVVNGL